jgi:hypothetical protein
MKPRWIVSSLEVVSILVCILLLHHLETRHIEIWEVLAESARGAILLCHDCVLRRMEKDGKGNQDPEEYTTVSCIILTVTRLLSMALSSTLDRVPRFSTTSPLLSIYAGRVVLVMQHHVFLSWTSRQSRGADMVTDLLFQWRTSSCCVDCATRRVSGPQGESKVSG